MCERVLPELKRRLAACGALANERFWMEAANAGSAGAVTRFDARGCRYHQHGELNFWMPLTCQSKTKTTIWLSRGGGGRLLAVGHRGGSGCDVSRDAGRHPSRQSYELDDVDRLQGRRGGVLRPGMVHEGDQGGSQQDAGDVVNRK